MSISSLKVRLNFEVKVDSLRDVMDRITLMYYDFIGYMYYNVGIRHNPHGNSTSNRKFISGYTLYKGVVISLIFSSQIYWSCFVVRFFSCVDKYIRYCSVGLHQIWRHYSYVRCTYWCLSVLFPGPLRIS